MILGHLERGQCVVQFSGGRDSSLVLAVAAHVARTHGFAVPRAVAVRYAGVAAAREDAWQELVANHVGVELEVINVARGGDDLAGPFGVSRLDAHGPTFPPTCGVLAGRIADAVRGRIVLTGEGGDEVLGGSRITPFTHYLRGRTLPSRGMARALLATAAPQAIRRPMLRRRLAQVGHAPWLNREAQAKVHNAIARDLSGRSWDWRQARLDFLDSRLCAVGFGTMSVVGRREGFEFAHPLIEDHFVLALCRQGGWTGLPGRTAAMRLLAGDLLPEAVLARASKATFNHVYAGDAVRSFARQWDGSGVDPGLIDVEALRSAWLAEEIAAPSLVPLQLAMWHARSSGWSPDKSELEAPP